MSEQTCLICSGRGVTSGRQYLEEQVGKILAGPGPEGYLYSDYLTLTTNLAGRAPTYPLGHDTLDRHHATQVILRAAGLDPATWGICPNCKGSGHHE